MDQHAVFAKLIDGDEIRISGWMSWREAIDAWELLDDTLRTVKSSKDGWTTVNYFAVRHHGDPRWTPTPFAPERVQGTVGKGSKDDKAVLRRIGMSRGLEGRAGGWVYRNGKPVTQGWWSFFKEYKRKGFIVVREFPTGRTYERTVRRDGVFSIATRTETVEITESRYYTNVFDIDLAIASKQTQGAGK